MLGLLCSLALAQAPDASSRETPAPVVAPDAAQAMRQVIDDQIAAFRRDDAPGAWRHVAPGLKRKFGTADRFLEMVRVGYAPVYRPKRYDFGEVIRTPDGFGQWLDVEGPSGERLRALYLMERQPDGTWMTSGCLLFEPEASTPAV